MVAGDQRLVHTLIVSSGYWSPCAPLVWNQGFPTPPGGLSMSTNPVRAPDIRFSSSQFRKQYPCCEKAFSTSSEDGTVCFWDNRVMQNGSFKASSVFKPYLNSELSRSKLGSWLTTLSCKQFEEDWFVTGGGPRLSLWSRRAGRNVSILHPEGKSS
ncbi:unnamed protein product [Schistosoma curassoni]|uniref:WD_REPEATS_REGION domain-containing protein n=1 Tax=Schistosoma curassoni TaxID=6186 RepID=A0A183KLL5_9TREM|nr:unnamed protein product [Schistosoma curassoni]